MTQVASPESVRGKFNDVTLELEGETYRLERKDDEFWVELADPERKLRPALTNSPPAGQVQRVRRRVSLTTGSHHMQAYWLDLGHGNLQFSLPFTYLFEQERWVPRRSVFMTDPHATGWSQVWNVGCVDCHATAGQPRRQTGDSPSFDTRVAELGIACEACHGPAAEHVRRSSDPALRAAMRQRGRGDPSIVSPGRLSPRRASEVCGRCHSVHATNNQDDWLRDGETYRPGDDLEAKLKLIRRPQSPESRRSMFWNDGMIRISGREYNGLVNSPCYLKGELSCLSCHSMHDSSPVNQLAEGMDGNSACVRCHPAVGKDLTGHTHHAAGSTGSLCYNCHMPYTTYGLMKALRSHQISSPDVMTSVNIGRPNACNLCHLDRTLAWTASKLSDWYKIPTQTLPAEDQEVAASVNWALKGDAGQRALVAWHLGWPAARAAAGENWFAPYLSVLLQDPYPVVRFIAARSLGQLPGYGDFHYDYLASPEDRRLAAERAFALWTDREKRTPRPELLLDRNGRLDQPKVQDLLGKRNNRIVELKE